MTILAVDDAPENIDVIKSILVPDYTIKGATSGAIALKIAESQRPDLILLDIIMPDMDGYEVCRRLKANAATRDIPVIFLTAKDQTEDEARGLELGAVDYIAKPIRPPILRARMRTHLALASAIQQLAAQNNALVEAARLREDVENITRHDLKSPLNTIIGVPQILMMQCEFNENQREMVALIEEAGYRMLNMINRSLDIFKMETGIYRFDPERVNLLTVMRNVLAELGTAIEGKRLDVKILVNEQEPGETQRVNAAAEKLLCHSMFSNLIKNAIEASPKGGELSIRFANGAEVVTTIENSGEVPEQIRGRFFEKYVTAGKQEGTGLGTYSAMLVARTQNGSIALDSSVAGRTSIQVRLTAD